MKLQERDVERQHHADVRARREEELEKGTDGQNVFETQGQRCGKTRDNGRVKRGEC